tara:strand:+ start:4202 stop:4648 length:447 start_codon:yes stop_codon:yes gene_type:complete
MRYKGSPRRHFSIAAQKRFVRSPVKKKRRFKRHRSGFRVRQEIRREFYSDRLSIPKRAFARLCREILSNQHVIIDRMESSALEALQRAAEYHLISLFRHTNEFAMHSKRVTIQPQDLRIAGHLMERQTQTILSNNPNVSGRKAAVPRG